MKFVAWTIALGFVVFGVLFGGTLVWIALEHAEILTPAIAIRPEFLMTTKEVIKQLLAGQLVLIVDIGFAWCFWRHAN
jgi:hypothetical protein